ISMAGGKLTGYRKMAEQAVNTVTKQLKQEEGIIYSPSNTEHLPISGGETGGSKGYVAFKAQKIKEGEKIGLPDKEMKLLLQKYGINDNPSNTQHLPISVGKTRGSKGYFAYKAQKIKEGEKIGLPEKEMKLLLQKYGANVDSILSLYADHKESSPDGMDPLVFAELQYGLSHEMVVKPVDFFIRRTGALFFDIDWVREHKNSVCHYISKCF